MAIAPGIVGDARVRARLAAFDMPAAGRAAAALDGRHDLELAAADMTRMGSTPCRAMAAEDIRDLERRTRQERRVTRAASPS
jgi:hypothetical protein